MPLYTQKNTLSEFIPVSSALQLVTPKSCNFSGIFFKKNRKKADTFCTELMKTFVESKRIFLPTYSMVHIKDWETLDFGTIWQVETSLLGRWLVKLGDLSGNIPFDMATSDILSRKPSGGSCPNLSTSLRCKTMRGLYVRVNRGNITPFYINFQAPAQYSQFTNFDKQLSIVFG